MNKSEIKNKIVELFNSIDSSKLNSNQHEWYVFISEFVESIDEPNVTKQHLIELLGFTKQFRQFFVKK
jgi:hypothetical protein